MTNVRLEGFADLLAGTEPAGHDGLFGQAKLLAVKRADDGALEAAANPRWLSMRANLGQLVRDGIPDPKPVKGVTGIAKRLLLRGQLASFQGHPESMKTTAAMAAGYDYMLAGGNLVYLDWENGEEETARRLRDIAAAMPTPKIDGKEVSFDRLLDERLFYAYVAGTEPDWEACELIASEWPDAIWLWDSARGIIRSYGGDEDRAKDVGQFMDPLEAFAKRKGSPVASTVVIDHVTKETTAKSRYARGSGDKHAGMQVGWYFEATEQPTRTTPGRVTLHNKKNRSGVLPKVQTFKVGDGRGGLLFEPTDPDHSPEGKRESAIIVLLKHRHPDALSVRQIRGARTGDDKPSVSGKPDAVKATVEVLADDPGRPVRRIIEADGTERYQYAPDDDREPMEPLDI